MLTTPKNYANRTLARQSGRCRGGLAFNEVDDHLMAVSNELTRE
jgi:hypothetical protein